MILKWKTNDVEITRVAVDRETKHYVFFNGLRFRDKQAKRSDFECFFDTWQEAHDHLIKRAEARLRAAESALSGAQRYLRTLENMEEPNGDR